MKRRMQTHAATFAVALLTATASMSSAAADDWDTGAPKDNIAVGTRNELQVRQWQRHDLEAIGGTADEDWFVAKTDQYRTYQVTVGEVSGDTPIDNDDFLTLWNAAGTTQLQSAAGGAGSTGKSIRWVSDSATSFRIRVKGNAGSTVAAKYSISYEATTLYCARYNNTGTQTSVVIVQNASTSGCDVFVAFKAENGAALGGTSASIPGFGTLVMPAGNVAGVPGTKGSVHVLPATSCAASDIKGKVVALEPSTGFSFDTPCSRP